MTATKSNLNSGTHQSSVIVRAYGDEPVVMVVENSGAGWIEVARSPGTETLRLPARLVFTMDDLTLQALATAYDSGEKAKLAKLWRRAKLYAAR